MDTIQDMIAAQRGELAAVLDALPASGWDEPTLCTGWRVREVVAHVTMPFRYSGRRFVAELARSRGRFNEMADRVALRDAARIRRPSWPGRSGRTPATRGGRRAADSRERWPTT